MWCKIRKFAPPYRAVKVCTGAKLVKYNPKTANNGNNYSVY